MTGNNEIRFIGVLTNVEEHRGYGFIDRSAILRTDGLAVGAVFEKDIFCHVGDLAKGSSGVKLVVGARISFHLQPGKMERAMRAKDIRFASESDQ